MAEAKIKRKKKRWVHIISGKPFENQDLGESYVAEAAELKGKAIKLNLMSLLNNPRKQNINIGFRIEEVHEGKGIANVSSYEMIPSAVKRMVRRGRDKIDDSFLAETKDNKKIRIKPIIITGSNTVKSEQTRLRLKAREVLTEFSSKHTFDQITQQLIDGKLQKILKDELNKLYPLKTADIRAAKIEA